MIVIVLGLEKISALQYYSCIENKFKFFVYLEIQKTIECFTVVRLNDAPLLEANKKLETATVAIAILMALMAS